MRVKNEPKTWAYSYLSLRLGAAVDDDLELRLVEGHQAEVEAGEHPTEEKTEGHHNDPGPQWQHLLGHLDLDRQ